MNRKLKEELDKDGSKNLVVLKISNTLRTVGGSYVNRKYLTLVNESSREKISSSLVEVCFPHSDDVDWENNWNYDRESVKRVLKLQKINTDNLNENLCIHKVKKITKNIIVTANKNRKVSNGYEIPVVIDEFADSVFLLGYIYYLSNDRTYFEDLGDVIETFEDKLDEEMKYPVFVFKEEKIDHSSVAKIIRDL